MKKNLAIQPEEKKQNEELIKVHEREIFRIIEQKQEENTYFTLILGNYKIKEFDTLELADLYLTERPNELIFAMISIAVETALKELKK